jgi:hypothetical protein
VRVISAYAFPPITALSVMLRLKENADASGDASRETRLSSGSPV